MFGMETLDVLIGLVTVYLVFGMACTAMVEAISAWLGVRGSNLEAALNEFLAGNLSSGENFVQAFYAHPLIYSLSKGKDGRPSYISPEIVAQVVVALVTRGSRQSLLKDAVASMPDQSQHGKNHVKLLLDTFLTQSNGDAAAFRKMVEVYFNTTMERASGWFKRYMQWLAIMVSAVIVLGANVDTVSLATGLASNPAAREKIVEIADQHLNQAKTAEEQLTQAGGTQNAGRIEEAKRQTGQARRAFEKASADLESAGLRLGWNDYPKTFGAVVTKLFGLLVSILAVSLGAPFWFDVLQRFMKVRAAGLSPDEKKPDK